MRQEIRTICQDAIDTWGIEAQVGMAEEEMGELSVALHHFRRGRATMDDVRTEIADVLITAAQLAIIFCEDEVSAEMNRKLERLKQRLEKAKKQTKESYGD